MGSIIDFLNKGYDKAKKEAFFAPNTKEAKAIKIMEIETPFTQKELKIQYKKLVKKYHPDIHGGNKEKEEHFKKITEANKTLQRSLKKHYF